MSRILLLAFCVTACTDASLYRNDGATIGSDRLALRGRICAQDTLNADLPIRVVIVGDYANGPLFSTFDPAALRIQRLRSFVQSALNDDNLSIAVVGFAGRSRKLAPLEGNFTRNPGELLAALEQLGLPQPCAGPGQCRDYLDGLRTARTLIEGDLAATPAGTRILTQYVVMFFLAGPAEPLANDTECCAPDDAACIDQTPTPSATCQAQRELAEVDAMVDAVGDSGGLGLKLHVFQFGADPDADVNNTLESAMQNMSFAAGGTFTRFNTPDAISSQDLDVLDIRTPLRVKTLIGTNLQAKPGPDGPLVDSDGDGLSDEEEERVGTSPGSWDTDGDFIGDLTETLVNFDPGVEDTPNQCLRVDATEDRDLDGLYDCEEVLLGTEPTLVDSDGDGMPDLLEVVSSTDYLESDAEADNDGDGATNGDELVQRTDPRSTDTRSHLSFGYRYDLEDQGVVRELFALDLISLTGLEIVSMTDGTTPGVGRLSYDAENQTLRWQDALDSRPGPAVAVGAGGEFDLPSSSYAPVQGEDGRQIRVRITVPDLPPADVTEDLRIIFRERQCVEYTVRNIKLMDAAELDDGTGPGLNRVLLFFAETPEGRLDKPGPYRIAEIPVTFIPPSTRMPEASILEVLEEEFVRPR